MTTPFPSSPGPLYQNEVKCSSFDMKMIFHFHANKTHFRNKDCALGLILKVRVFGTLKWPIEADVGTETSSSTLCLNARLNSNEKFLSNPLFVPFGLPLFPTFHFYKYTTYLFTLNFAVGPYSS